jgi:uncharacterized protein YneF (UPF0154 family)
VDLTNHAFGNFNDSSFTVSDLGTYSLWSIGIVLSCILGVAIGFAVRPYVIRHTGRSEPPLVHHDMEASPNQIGGTSSDLLLLH